MAGQCNATLDCSFDYDNLGCDGNTLFSCFNISNAVFNELNCPFLTSNILFQLFIVYGMNGWKVPAHLHVVLEQELTHGVRLSLNLMEVLAQDLLRKL